MTEKDFFTDPSFDHADLESKLNEIEADVNSLISNPPVEAIDDDEEWEEEYPGDFEISSGCALARLVTPRARNWRRKAPIAASAAWKIADLGLGRD